MRFSPKLSSIACIAIFACAIFLSFHCAVDKGRPEKKVRSSMYEGFACAPDPVLARQSIGPSDDCAPEKKDYLYLPFDELPVSVEEDPKGTLKSRCLKGARRHLDRDGLLSIQARRAGISLRTTTDMESQLFLVIAANPIALKSAGIYDCRPVRPNPHERVKGTGKEVQGYCICVVYFRYPGGYKALEKDMFGR